MNKTNKAWINGLFLVVTLIINGLGALGAINGLSQKQISDMYVTLITPSPATFMIWSVIYSILFISVIVMIMKQDDSYYEKATNQITVLFRISCILNIAWMFAFSYLQIELSVLFILGLVIILSLICQKLLNVNDGKHWLLPLSFGIYTGWLFIATVVNIAVALVKVKWNGFGIADEIWAILVLIMAIVLAIVVLWKNHNAAFPLPIAWGYIGIYQNLKSLEGFKGEYDVLQNVALVGMVVLMGMAAIQFYRNHLSILPSPNHH